MDSKVLKSTNFKEVKFFKRGKVRDIYDLGNKLLIVSTDRISCFDVVLPDVIPGKGKILNNMSLFWFKFMEDILESHLITSDISVIARLSGEIEQNREILDGRVMLVKKTKPIPFECVVRGYLAGSGWEQYKTCGRVSGINLPSGLRESDKLPEPIFTPSTKAESGHDISVTEEKMREVLGIGLFEYIKSKSIEIYKKAHQYAESKGIIIADTKFEFGTFEDKIILIDELLTPDSSRFWPKDEYQPGCAQKSFDKQFVRDYLNSLSWDKSPPAPKLPPDIIEKTSQRYLKVFNMLTS